MKAIAAAFTIISLCTSTLMAEIKTEKIEYKQGDVVLEGFLAYDDAAAEKRPGVLVVHEWWGMNDYAQQRTKQLAELGYVAFALDMYGKGKATTEREKAGALAKPLRENRQLMRDRALAGLEVLKKHEKVNPAKI